MDEEKNRYPQDFKRWHDIRIDEYNTLKLKRDEEKRKDFYAKFAAVANKYLNLEYNDKSAILHTVIILFDFYTKKRKTYSPSSFLLK